ncbi:MAG: hypothetical protein U9P90_02085 [Patescibacteria group bacterium]|nr:hypothetical protein [Patescibacteria group bacterium]
MTDKQFEHFTDLKILNTQLPKLDDELENAIVKFINNCVANSQNLRANCKGHNITDKCEKIDKADRLEHEDYIKNKPVYRSKVFLPWINQAHLSIVAYMAAMIFTGNFFQFIGRTPEDDEHAERITNIISYLFETDYNFRKVLVHALYQCAKRGNTCIKGFWEKIISYEYKYREQLQQSIDPVTGQITSYTALEQIKEEIVKYNDIRIEFIDIDDFHFYPCHAGAFKNATHVHREEKSFSELNNRKDIFGKKFYINLEKLNIDKEQDDIEQTPIEIKTAFIPEIYHKGKKLNNIMVVTAQNEHIIRFQPYPYDYGLSPYMWTTLNNIEGYDLGLGLCFNAIGLQNSGNLLFNLLIDAMKQGVNPMMLIPNEESLPNELFTSRPGGIIPYPTDLLRQNVKPEPYSLDLTKIPLTFETVFLIKKEFENETIPEMVKGIRPQKDETATRDILVQQGGENKLTIPADNYNEELLKSLLIFCYVLYRQRSEVDPDVKIKLAKICIDHTKKVEQIFHLPVTDPITGEFLTDDFGSPITEPQIQEIDIEKTEEEILQEFGNLPSFEKIDISVKGYRSNIKKQQMIRNLQVLFSELRNFASDELKLKIDDEQILQNLFSYLDFDTDNLLLSDDEAMQKQIKQIENVISLEVFKQMKMQESGLIPQIPQDIQGAVNE